MGYQSASQPRQRSSERFDTVELRLLGSFELIVNGRVTRMISPAQRLLAIVALRRASRSQAAELIWPDTDYRHTQGRLRTTMWRIRQACDDLLDASGYLVRLRDSVVVDVHQLLRWAQQASSGEQVLGLRFLSHGDCELLPSWDDSWVTLERERLRQLRLHGLEDYARALMEQRIFGSAVQAALAAIAGEPLRESGYRTLIEIHLAEGNLDEASRTYHRYQRLLYEELGVEPSPNLQSLVINWGLAGHRKANSEFSRAARRARRDVSMTNC